MRKLKFKKNLRTSLIAGSFAVLSATSAFAASEANGTNLAPVAPTSLQTRIDSTLKIGGDEKSTNRLSVIANSNDTTSSNNWYSPTGPKALKMDTYVQEAAANLTNVKVVTLNVDADDADFNALAALAANSPSANYATGGASSSYELNYDNSFVSNGTYFQYVLDMNNHKVYKTYFKDGTRASYRVIKTSDIDTKSMADLTSPNYKPSKGYITDEQMAAAATRGEIKPATAMDPTDPSYAADTARNPVSGDTVYKYTNNTFATRDASNLDPSNIRAWQDTLGVGPSQYDGVIGPKGTPKAEDRGVTGRTVYDYVQPQINNIYDKIDEVKAGVALSTAIANIPDNFREGDLNQFGVGYGYYGNHSAVAVGYQRRFDDNRKVFKLTSAYNTKGQFSVGAGYGMSW